jgi:hypothetical protein
VKGETGERWRKLCEQAAVEQDPERLLELAKEISLACLRHGYPPPYASHFSVALQVALL